MGSRKPLKPFVGSFPLNSPQETAAISTSVQFIWVHKVNLNDQAYNFKLQIYILSSQLEIKETPKSYPRPCSQEDKVFTYTAT